MRVIRKGKLCWIYGDPGQRETLKIWKRPGALQRGSTKGLWWNANISWWEMDDVWANRYFFVWWFYQAAKHKKKAKSKMRQTRDSIWNPSRSVMIKITVILFTDTAQNLTRSLAICGEIFYNKTNGIWNVFSSPGRLGYNSTALTALEFYIHPFIK